MTVAGRGRATIFGQASYAPPPLIRESAATMSSLRVLFWRTHAATSVISWLPTVLLDHPRQSRKDLTEMLVRRDPKRRALVAPDARSWACMSCSFDRPDGGTGYGHA
jgi:hypothetical protein